MSLALFLGNHWIREHHPSREEIANLFALADRDLQASQTPGLEPDWRFDIAYNAALQLALAALAAAGYRPERQNTHLRAIECLAFTVQLSAAEVNFLDICRRKRHTAVYEQVGVISDQEADEMVARAKRLRELVVAWMRAEHPELMP